MKTHQLKDQKIKVMRQLDSIESQLEDSDLNENKEEALKQRVTQLKRLISSLEKSGDIEGLEKLLNQALTQGVGSTLKQKFIDCYFIPKVTKPKVTEQIKKEVQEELKLKDETQGLKLTVTEKINWNNK